MPGSWRIGLTRLVAPTPGEARLALPTGRGASLYVALAHLGVGDPVGLEPRHREPALANQQDPPRRGRRTCGNEPLDVGRFPTAPPEREACREGGPVTTAAAECPPDDSALAAAPPRTEFPHSQTTEQREG